MKSTFALPFIEKGIHNLIKLVLSEYKTDLITNKELLMYQKNLQKLAKNR